MGFEFTPKQAEAQNFLSSIAMYVMLFGGSRSGKTFLHVRNVIMRALKAPKFAPSHRALPFQPSQSVDHSRHLPEGDGAVLPQGQVRAVED
jgi:hypothetical protein